MRFIQGAIIVHHKPEIEQDFWISQFLSWHPTAQLRQCLGRDMQELSQENVPLQVFGLWACPANSGLASPHYHVSQLFKINPSQAHFNSRGKLILIPSSIGLSQHKCPRNTPHGFPQLPSEVHLCLLNIPALQEKN